MIELNKVVHFPIFVPHSSFAGPDPIDLSKIDVSPKSIIFHLQHSGYHKDYYRYVCISAYEACGYEAKCTSPMFAALKADDDIKKYIPEKTIEWMQKFVDMLVMGAQWGKRNLK